MDVAWELVPVDTKRGREVLALAIILTDDQLPVEETQELRKTDRTTGISTRQTLVTQAEETFNRQLDTQWAVLRLKISGMRRINQALGQNMGDHALHQAVGRIVRSLEEGERVGRVAGNEFILLIHHKGDDHTVERIQAMDLLFDEPVKVGLLQFMLHLNVGIARYPQDGSTAQDLDRRATIAFERTRRSGFHYSFFSLALEDHVLAYSWVPAEAQRALRECEFQLHYQPVVDTRTGETVSIGKPVAVNMTADTITAPDFLKRLDSALAQSKLPPNWLTLELTERVFSSPELAAEMVTVSTLSA
jgi:diguanylate cyclase (GGDEF)-like protein